MITVKDIEGLASLSRIELSDEEKQKMTSEIESILGYVGQVTKLDVSSVSKDFNQTNVLREDVVLNKGGEFSEKLLANAPQRDGDYFKVKKILN